MDFTRDEINELSSIKKARAALQIVWDDIMQGLGAEIIPQDPIDRQKIGEILGAENALVNRRQEIIEGARGR